MASLITNLASLFGSGSCQEQGFLGLIPWYHYLTSNMSVGPDGVCQFTNFNPLGSTSDILLILLAVIDDLFRIIGLVTVFVVIYGALKYITSQGEPSETAKAMSTIINALIGLAIAIIAIPTISFLGNTFQGTPQTVQPLTTALPNPTGIGSGTGFIQTILTLVFGIVGALSFLFVIIGGFRYVLSQGDPQNVNRAKDTIIYALVGMAIAIAAVSIVSLVTRKL